MKLCYNLQGTLYSLATADESYIAAYEEGTKIFEFSIISLWDKLKDHLAYLHMYREDMLDENNELKIRAREAADIISQPTATKAKTEQMLLDSIYMLAELTHKTDDSGQTMLNTQAIENMTRALHNLRQLTH